MKSWLIKTWNGVLQNLLATGIAMAMLSLTVISFFSGLARAMMRFLATTLPLGAVLLTLLVIGGFLVYVGKANRVTKGKNQAAPDAEKKAGQVDTAEGEAESEVKPEQILVEELKVVSQQVRKLNKQCASDAAYIVTLEERLRAAGKAVPNRAAEIGSVMPPSGHHF